MTYTNLVKKAIKLAYNLHKGETDEYGLPIIYNVYSIANNIDNEYGFCAALLYMAVENKKTTLENLKKDFPFEVTDTIFMLKTDDSLAYPDYIRRIKINPIATQIKIAEINNRISLLELKEDKGKIKIELEKYQFALNILKK